MLQLHCPVDDAGYLLHRTEIDEPHPAQRLFWMLWAAN